MEEILGSNTNGKLKKECVNIWQKVNCKEKILVYSNDMVVVAELIQKRQNINLEWNSMEV